MTTAPSQAGPLPLGKPASNATDVEALARSTDTRGPIWLGFWVLVVGFGLVVAWAAWAPLDEGVAAGGVVSLETRRKTIQHAQGGVIKQVGLPPDNEHRALRSVIGPDREPTLDQIAAYIVQCRAFRGYVMV